ncbi:hypothetical protein HDV05_000984, partial [Chytridiales sp. JEL 0842]
MQRFPLRSSVQRQQNASENAMAGVVSHHPQNRFSKPTQAHRYQSHITMVKPQTMEHSSARPALGDVTNGTMRNGVINNNKRVTTAPNKAEGEADLDEARQKRIKSTKTTGSTSNLQTTTAAQALKARAVVASRLKLASNNRPGASNTSNAAVIARYGAAKSRVAAKAASGVSAVQQLSQTTSSVTSNFQSQN